ncbi:MAG: hypothetical protein SCALA702_28090 [Melioribacteraceae bacterium]|nr:MAG: hypothetical protein SCALA702_28090 [Melioribacteraceae bacterium]
MKKLNIDLKSLVIGVLTALLLFAVLGNTQAVEKKLVPSPQIYFEDIKWIKLDLKRYVHEHKRFKDYYTRDFNVPSGYVILDIEQKNMKIATYEKFPFTWTERVKIGKVVIK